MRMTPFRLANKFQAKGENGTRNPASKLPTPRPSSTCGKARLTVRAGAAVCVHRGRVRVAYYAGRNEQLAMKHAALAVEATILNSGPDFSDVDSMRELMEKHRSHWSRKMRIH